MRWWRLILLTLLRFDLINTRGIFYFNADLTGTGSLPICICMYNRQDAGIEDSELHWIGLDWIGLDYRSWDRCKLPFSVGNLKEPKDTYSAS